MESGARPLGGSAAVKALVGLALIATAIAPIPDDVVAWVRAQAAPIGAADGASDAREVRVLRSIIGEARVIGLGEPFHGHEEPLAYRNRLVRHLVEHEGVTAVAVESGLADTLFASEYVLGEPGGARAAVASMSWRFGTLAANVALVAWLRRWNDAHPRAKVRFYGIDVSGGDEQAGFGNARVALDRLAAHLARAPADNGLRGEIARLAPIWSPAGYAAASATDRTAMVRLPDALAAELVRRRAALTRATSAAAQAGAERVALDAGEAVRIFAVWPADARTISPGLIAATDRRERAMAAHTLWALRQEGPSGRVLLFQSNSHVAATALMAVGRPSGGDMRPVGAQLRAALGHDYRVLLFASALGRGANDPAIGTVDRAFAAAGTGPALLDVRHAPAWWNARQTLAHGGIRINAAVPSQAADGLYFVDRLTPARTVEDQAR